MKKFIFSLSKPVKIKVPKSSDWFSTFYLEKHIGEPLRSPRKIDLTGLLKKEGE